MVSFGCESCSKCGGALKYYDTVTRLIRTKNRRRSSVYIRRLRCSKCNSLHRELPKTIYPFKQYESEIIYGVIYGFITSATIGFEDYPCELTMKTWKRTVSTDFFLPEE